MAVLRYNMSLTRRFDPSALRESTYARLDDYHDSFAKIADVKTDMLFGDLAAVPQPMISVILPTYQRSALLEDALGSIVRQQHVGVAWECVVVDNTPLDDSNCTPALDILRRLNDPRVLYYHHRVNLGSGYNWNRGVELARGKWVCFLHDDDVLFPDALRNIVRIIRLQSSCKLSLGCIQARRVMFSDSSELAHLRRNTVPYFEPLTRMRALIRGESGTGAPSCGTTFLKQAYMACGGINYDFGLTADAVLGYQIMRNYRVVMSDCVLGGYRWAENETLKLTSLQELIRSDYLFARYRYNQNALSWLWGCVFWRAEYNENVRYKIRDGQRKNISLKPQDFNGTVPYRKTNPVLFALYKLLQRTYSALSVGGASVLYMLYRCH